VAVGVAVLVVYLLTVILTGGSGAGEASPQASWLVANDHWIVTLNDDQNALRADNPAGGGSQAHWLADWPRLRDDAQAAAAAPNPGGSATVPWREMLNDYVAGSTEVIEGLAIRNAAEVTAAQRDLLAGDAAAHRFNHAMGIAGS
jgi:hypothetical protein